MPTAAPARDETRALTIVDRVEQSKAIAMLEARAPALRQMLPDDDAVARFNRGVVIAMTKNPDLLSATPESILMACFEAAQQGLEPTGAAGGAHLVPYKVNGVKVAQLIPDYRGVIRLIMRDGVVTSVEANVVKEQDEFAYQLGSDPWVSHTPKLDPERSSRASTHAYAVFRLRGSKTPIIVVEDRAGIERIRKRGANADRSPWNTDWDEMAKKTMVKRGSKLCPVDPAIRSILVREDELLGIRDDDAPVATVPGARQSRASQLASRLKDVTPTGEQADGDDPQDAEAIDEAAWTGDTAEALTELSLAAFKGLREQHEISPVVVAKAARDLFPDAKGLEALDDAQRAQLWTAIAPQAPADS